MILVVIVVVDLDIGKVRLSLASLLSAFPFPASLLPVKGVIIIEANFNPTETGSLRQQSHNQDRIHQNIWMGIPVVPD